MTDSLKPIMSKQRRILKSSSNFTGQRDIYLKSPNLKEQRKKFSIVERTYDSNGKATSRSIKSDDLDAINLRFNENQISLEQAKSYVRDLIQQLKPQVATLFHSDNQRILFQYWKVGYENRELAAPEAAKNRLYRAIRAVGHYSLQSASRDELQGAVDSALRGNAQRSAVAAINQILIFLKRGFKLRKTRETMSHVKYLTPSELNEILSQSNDDDFNLLCKVAFSTGMRASEIFAIESQDFHETHLSINSQITESGLRTSTKTRRSRNAAIIPGWEAMVTSWIQLPQDRKMRLRYMTLSRMIKKLSLKVLKRAHVFHHLRHSYAVYLVSKGVSVSLVAQSLGNGPQVTARYYSGFILVPESIANIRSILTLSQ